MTNEIITFGIATKITTEKRKKYLYECINSILKQSSNNFEIIISNDNSTINVNWDKYKNNPQIKIFHQKKSLGIFKNFNFCLEKTNSKWFIPMGDDDLIENNFIETILEISKNNLGVELIYFNHKNIDGDGKIFNKTKILLKDGDYYYMKNKKYNYSQLLWSSPSSFFSIVDVKKIKKLGGFPDYGMTTDGYIAFLYFLKFKGYFKNVYIAKLRRHSENASGYNDVILFMDERINLINIIIEKFGEELQGNGIDYLNNEKKYIKYSHIKLMKNFRDYGRLKGIKFGIEYFKNSKNIIKTIIIFIIGIILGKNIQKGFNFISIIYENTNSKIRGLIINNK